MVTRARIASIFLVFMLVGTALAHPVAAQMPEIEEVSARELMAAVRAGGAPVTIVNVWATWCTPCREEMPDLVEIGREFGSDTVRVMFVSADHAEDVPEARMFLAEHGVSGSSFMKRGRDAAFAQAISHEWTGALPATALYDASGTRLDFWEGRKSYQEMSERVRRALTGQPRTEGTERQ